MEGNARTTLLRMRTARLCVNGGCHRLLFLRMHCEAHPLALHPREVLLEQFHVHHYAEDRNEAVRHQLVFLFHLIPAIMAGCLRLSAENTFHLAFGEGLDAGAVFIEHQARSRNSEFIEFEFNIVQQIFPLRGVQELRVPDDYRNHWLSWAANYNSQRAL